MESFIKYQRIILIAAIIVGAIASLLLLIIFPKEWSLAAGLAFGVVGGLIVLRLKVLAIYKFSQNPELPPVKVGFQTNAVMIGLLVGVIVVNKYLYGAEDIFNVWTTLAGLVLPNAILMADGFFRPVKHTVSDTEE